MYIYDNYFRSGITTRAHLQPTIRNKILVMQTLNDSDYSFLIISHIILKLFFENILTFT
jgi:hypothetical protein